MKKIIKFLRKPRWFTTDWKCMINSPFELGRYEWNYAGTQWWYLSILGVINGLLYHLGLVIVVIDDTKLEIRKPWF